MLLTALIVTVVGYTAIPIAADGSATGALIAGVFSTVNVLLTIYLTREVRGTHKAVRGAKHAARLSIDELKDVKRKVSGERRKSDKPLSGGKRSSDPDA